MTPPLGQRHIVEPLLDTARVGRANAVGPNRVERPRHHRPTSRSPGVKNHQEHDDGTHREAWREDSGQRGVQHPPAHGASPVNVLRPISRVRPSGGHPPLPGTSADRNLLTAFDTPTLHSSHPGGRAAAGHPSCRRPAAVMRLTSGPTTWVTLSRTAGSPPRWPNATPPASRLLSVSR